MRIHGAARFPRLINFARQAYEKESTRAFRKVYVIWGGAGTGKTKRAHDADPDVYTLLYATRRSKITMPAGGWWDGYEQEETLLIGEFYGGIKHSLFLSC